VLVLQMRQAVVPQNSTVDAASLDGRLPEGFQPVIQPTRHLQASVFGAPVESVLPDRPNRPQTGGGTGTGEALWTEIYSDGSCAVVLTLERGRARVRSVEGRAVVDPGLAKLNLHAIGPKVDPPALAAFEDLVSKTFEVHFAPHYYASTRFRELLEEGRTPAPDAEASELGAARAVADRSLRTLAIAIKSSGGLLVGDLPKQLPADARDQTDSLRDKLRVHGFVAEESVIVCRKTQAQVARAPSPAVLTQLSLVGLRCGCGRPMAEEKTEEALTVTDRGRQMLDGSHWFSILLVDELRRLGVPSKSILVEQTQGGDEMDVLAEISGELVLFELKDKEFSLGNAYSFGAKIGIIRPDHSVIVTTDRVGNDARDHFKRAGDAQRRPRHNSPWERIESAEPPAEAVQYIEGLNSLRPRLEEIVSGIYAGDAQRILATSLGNSSIDASALVRHLSEPRSVEPLDPTTTDAPIPQQPAATRQRKPSSGVVG
jgi:hypothetical protein